MAALLNVLASNRRSLENLNYTIEFICFYHPDWTGVEILDDKQSVKAKNKRELCKTGPCELGNWDTWMVLDPWNQV